MSATNLVRITVVFGLLFCNSVSPEWVDMPQFSSEKKIYRVSSNYFHKFNHEKSDNPFIQDQQDNIYTSMTKMEQSSTNVSLEKPPVVSKYDDQIDETTFHPQTVRDDELPSAEQGSTWKYDNESTSMNEEDVLEYLPIDLLQNVHRVLKSQPLSAEGKLQFLKGFEKTLMTEIESRLTNMVISSRKKRGASSHHYEHGYDEHEEHSVGFPSIEGALMAISFLTFAVYLVRLVMLLFRNMGNMMQTTPNPTLFVGRRKRSVNQFDDEIVRILNSVNHFSNNYIHVRDHIS